MNKNILNEVNLDAMSRRIDSLTSEVKKLREVESEQKNPEIKPLLKISELIEMSGNNLTKYTITKDIEMGRLKVVSRGAKRTLIPKEDALKYLHLI
tara:strand:- start:266 stop:553 length:288 start_codon:yes stop_codon:yes gene_type:complete